MKVRRRKKKRSVGTDTEEAQSKLDAFFESGSKRPAKDQRGRKLSALEVAVEDAKKRSKTGEWEDAKGRTFVGLYALCHQIVYGVLPTELENKGELGKVSRLANRCLQNHFNGDADAMVEFLKWSWEREKRRQSWALRNGVDRNRLHGMFQFSAKLVTDYRADLEAKKRQGRRNRG